jgi:protocatechuate 3,4-dioxygenase beta subunit
LTNAQGYFVFSNLPRGRYAISADAFGYDVPRYETRLVQIDGADRHSITLHLWRYGSISGRVFDELGEPVVGVPVSVLRSLKGGRSPALRTLGEAVLTDDRGVYRIAELAPGSYVVGTLSTATSLPAGVGDELHEAASARAGGVLRSPLWEGLRDSAGNYIRSGEGIRVGSALVQGLGSHVLDPDGILLTYPTTFYPGTADGIDAQLVSVASGESRAGVDIPVRYSRTVRVSGSVTGPDGPVPRVVVRLLPPDTDAALAAVVPSVTAVTDSEGVFTFLGVFPGRYLMSVSKLVRRERYDYDATDDILWAQSSVTVGDSDVTGLQVRLSAGIRVSGRVVFEGASGAGLSEDRRMVVGLRPFGTGTTSKIGLSSSVRADGTFTTDAVPPGRYQLRFQISCRQPGACPTPAAWNWQTTSLNGDVLPYDVLELTTMDLTGVEAEFSETSTYLAGAVVDATGAARPDTHVMVFPADTDLWREDVSDRRIRRVHANTDGTFDIEGLPPGEYHLAAVKAPYPNGDPRDLERLIPLAVTVALGDGEHRAVELQVVTPRDVR